MTWRAVQLDGQLCDQDKKILRLVGTDPVRYVGDDPEFAQNLTTQDNASRLVLILNRPLWCSDIIEQCQKYLAQDITEFYIGINRYQILGNNTNIIFEPDQVAGINITCMLEQIVNKCGFVVTDKGYFDHDQGRYFNFIQPLTWVYGVNATNQS
jgi:hypothetical protein